MLASISTEKLSVMLAAILEICGKLTAVRVKTPTSRAIPATLKQSPRLGVKSTSKLTSSKFKYSRKSSPSGASVAKDIKPSELSAKPNSSAEHNMP